MHCGGRTTCTGCLNLLPCWQSGKEVEITNELMNLFDRFSKISHEIERLKREYRQVQVLIEKTNFRTSRKMK